MTAATAGTAGSGMKWVGRALRRLEDPALVTGRGRFTADLAAAHHIRFVRSPVASGRIVRIAAPEGAKIICAEDLDGARPIRPMLHKFNYQPIEQPLLAKDVVRFVGEPVAAVFAPSAAGAEDIAERVEVEIDELPAVIDARDALAPAAPRVHGTTNAPAMSLSKAGSRPTNFDAALAKAARRIRLNARSRRQNATPIETRAAHAAFDAATGRITLTCATQMPHLTRTAIADVLGFPESDLRVIAPDVGGGFGQKMSLPAEYVVLVWLARQLRASVAWSEDRRENLIAAFHSRDQHIELEGAFDADGKLIALAADVVANIGAYSCFPTTCGVEPLMAMAELPGPYDVRAYSCRARGVTTHTCTMAPYRGVSRPVITFAIERLMDKAAAEFALKPVEIRRRNLIARFPYTSATGPGVRRGQLYRDPRKGSRACRCAGIPRAPEERRAPAAAISASALRRFPSAPATAARPSPRAAWRSRRDGRTSRSSWIRPAGSKRASARARTARACARRSRKSSPTKSASRRTRCASSTATPTARLTAGAHSPAARW